MTRNGALFKTLGGLAAITLAICAITYFSIQWLRSTPPPRPYFHQYFELERGWVPLVLSDSYGNRAVYDEELNQVVLFPRGSDHGQLRFFDQDDRAVTFYPNTERKRTVALSPNRLTVCADGKPDEAFPLPPGAASRIATEPSSFIFKVDEELDRPAGDRILELCIKPR